MPDEEIRSLHRKMDVVMQAQREQRTQIDELRAEFHQAKGVIVFIKWASGFSVALLAVGATLWNLFKGQ